MAITVRAPQSRAFITRVRPFIRPSRPISRDVVTRVFPTSIDMHHLDMYSMKISILLSFFTVSKLILRSAEDSINKYDSDDSYDGDDDDMGDGELISIPVKEDLGK